jgi:hypothetical protein
VKLAKENLQNLTGGDSYAVVQPILTQRPDRDIPLAIENHGSNILAGVTVAIYDSGLWMPFTHDSIMRSVENRISVGTLNPGERLVLSRQTKPEQFMTVGEDTEPVHRAFLYIAAQNFTTTEIPGFKKVANGKWNYMYKIFRQPAHAGQVTKNGAQEPAVPLEQFGWSADLNHPSQVVAQK